MNILSEYVPSFVYLGGLEIHSDKIHELQTMRLYGRINFEILHFKICLLTIIW